MESPHFKSDWMNINLKIRWKRILRIFVQILMICIKIWDFHTFGNDNVKIGPCCPITFYKKAQVMQQAHNTSCCISIRHHCSCWTNLASFFSQIINIFTIFKFDFEFLNFWNFWHRQHYYQEIHNYNKYTLVQVCLEPIDLSSNLRFDRV